MTSSPGHEAPIYVVLPANLGAGEGMRRILSARDVAAFWMPPPWCFDLCGIDLPRAVPGLKSVTLESLPAVARAAVAAATDEVLDEHCARLWRSADERVRAHYLGRGLRSSLATMFRRAPRTLDVAPPLAFRADRILECVLEVQYRLAPGPGERQLLAPAEEASLALYPFDPTNAAARKELGLGNGAEPILEVFAYDDGRTRHRAFLEGIARGTGVRVIDPRG